MTNGSVIAAASSLCLSLTDNASSPLAIASRSALVSIGFATALDLRAEQSQRQFHFGFSRSHVDRLQVRCGFDRALLPLQVRHTSHGVGKPRDCRLDTPAA